MTTFVIRSRRVVTPDGDSPAAVHVSDGLISAVRHYDAVGSEGVRMLDLGSLVLMPGLVDTHVHVNEPGRTEWEGFDTATRAAAAGGVTSLLDMPLNSIPATTTPKALESKREVARGKCWVDVGFIGGVVPGNCASIEPLADAGVLAFKCFLVHSGVDEFPNVTECDLRAAMPELARLGLPLMVHAELPGPIEKALRELGAISSADARRYGTYLRSHPREAEHAAIALMLELCRAYGARVHIVHLSSSGALGMLRAAREQGLPVTAETCPHYLHFAAEDIPDGATTFKCAPPIRERENRDTLWRALGDGVIDMVASDHSPCPPALKVPDSGDFFRAWGGVSSLQLGLPVVWTEAIRRHRSVCDLARWMCERPATLAGLSGKGAIAPGRDADFVVWDPEAEFTVDAAALHQRHKLTPYAGERLLGLVRQTWVRGIQVYDGGRFASRPTGQLL